VIRPGDTRYRHRVLYVGMDIRGVRRSGSNTCRSRSPTCRRS
jgi:hypothetical protein